MIARPLPACKSKLAGRAPGQKDICNHAPGKDHLRGDCRCLSIGLADQVVAEAGQMKRMEKDFIGEFVRTWYSEKTWARLQGKTIHA
jgi:hypothetical protein